MSCTTGFGRCDYLVFLLKRPQGTTKILGTAAFAGTKTPAVLKFPSKGATTACVETPVNCPYISGLRAARTAVGWPTKHLPAGRRAGRSGGGGACDASPLSCFLFRSRKRLEKRRKRSHINASNVLVTRTSTPPAQTAYTCFHSRKRVHTRLSEKNRIQGLTRRNTGRFGWGRYLYPQSVPHVHRHPRAECQNGVLCRFGILAGRCSRRTQRACGTAMRLRASLFRGAAALLGCVIFFSPLSKLWLVYLGLSAFRMCETRGGITTLGALCVLPKRRTAACQKG